MTLATVATLAPPKLLTYQDYLTEGEVNRRYDIIDGVRHDMASPNYFHQKIAFRINRKFDDFTQKFGSGESVMAPYDILISYEPLRTRQPDVLFISNERLIKNRVDLSKVPLSVAPELIVEILSPSDTRRVLEDKLADYAKVGVLEAWIVNRDLRTVEVLKLSVSEDETMATYADTETVTSFTFPDLEIAVADIFTK